MFRSFAFTSYAVIVSSLFLFATSVRGSAPLANGSTILKPIHADVFERSAGLTVRAEGDVSRLDLRNKAHMAYGGGSEDGDFFLANMTLHAPSGMKILLMELFDSLTTAVDCKGDDGTMSLTFKGKEAYDYALAEWAWINDNDEDKFLLVANHEGCGPDSERQAYTISRVDRDEPKLTTFLSAQPAAWEDVAGTIDLDFGKFHPSPARRLRPRGFFDSIGQTIGDIVDGVEGAVEGVTDFFGKFGDFNFNEARSFSVAAGSPGTRSDLITSDVLALDCVNCYVKGVFTVRGQLSTDNFKLKSLALEAAPTGLEASVEMEALLTKSKTVNVTVPLFSAPIPGSGFEVPSIFKIGAAIELAINADITFEAVANFTFGLSASVPDSSKLTLDLVDVGQSAISGWNVNIDPKFSVNALSGSVNVSAAAKPRLTFGVDIVKTASLEAFIEMKLPQVSGELKGMFDSTGACSKEPGASLYGVGVKSELAIGVGVGVEGSLGGDARTLASKELYYWSKELFNQCYPILGDKSSNSTSSNSTSTTKGPSSNFTSTAKGAPSNSASIAKPSSNSTPTAQGAPLYPTYIIKKPSSNSTSTATGASPSYTAEKNRTGSDGPILRTRDRLDVSRLRKRRALMV